jgi:hypothetical protein
MSRSVDSRSPGEANDPREIGKWARVYAQNRSLGIVVFMVIFLILYLAMGGLPVLGILAFRGEHWFLFGLCIVAVLVAIAATVFLSVPRWGGKWIERLTERLYAKEGNVRLAAPQTRARKWIMGLLGAAFGACILASIVLFGYFRIAEKYMQPFSVIYCVPFLVGLWLLRRPAVGPIALLWPALYTLHAILIVAGAPIVFYGPWSSLNMLIPTAGYGLLVGLIGHAYSRFALRQLREAAEGGRGDESAEEPRP